MQSLAAGDLEATEYVLASGEKRDRMQNMVNHRDEVRRAGLDVSARLLTVGTSIVRSDPGWAAIVRQITNLPCQGHGKCPWNFVCASVDVVVCSN